MVKIIHLTDDGIEEGVIVLDDFTVEIVYSGIAEMLREAAHNKTTVAPSRSLRPEARQRRDKILTRVQR